MKFIPVVCIMVVVGSLVMPASAGAATNTTVTVKQLLSNPPKYKGQTVTVMNLTVGWINPQSINQWSGNDTSGFPKCLYVYFRGGVSEKVGDIETVTGIFTFYTSKTGRTHWELDPINASGVKKTGAGTPPKC